MKFTKTLLALLLLTRFVGAEPLPIKGDLHIPNLGVAKNEIRAYVDSGRYAEELQEVSDQAQRYLVENLSRFRGKKPAMVLDIDETSLSNYPHIQAYDFGYLPKQWGEWICSGQAPAIPGTLTLFTYARSHGVAVFFISAREESERRATEQNLRNAGFDGWEGLLMKSDSVHSTSAAFKTAQRKIITERGYSILVNMGDQQSDLDGGYAEATFKLPNPMYYVP